jgi:hypothetical protein
MAEPRPRRGLEAGSESRGGGAGQRDDRVLRATRWLSLFIAPFLVLGFGILYLFPDHTRELFAWTIRPRMTAMMLGAAYLGGTYFFVRAAASKRWHDVQAGFLPVAGFAALLGITTILHWDRFNHSHIAFITWTALYFTTPFLVTTVWLLNRRTDPGVRDSGDPELGRPVRAVLAALGVVVLALGAVLFGVPGAVLKLWPWMLTPLTARVVGSLFVLAGLAQLCVARDPRWSAGRITVHSQLLALAGIELAAVLSWGSFKPDSALPWVFVGGLLLLLVGVAALWGVMDTRRGFAAGSES